MIWKCEDYQGIAAFFLGAAQLAACPPGDWIPQVKSQHQPFESPHPVITSSNVGKFVRQDGAQLIGLKLIDERLWQENDTSTNTDGDQWADGMLGNADLWQVLQPKLVG